MDCTYYQMRASCPRPVEPTNRLTCVLRLAGCDFER